MLLLKQPYPPVWKPVRRKPFNMIFEMPNPSERSTCCCHCHKIIDHHLSVDLSSAVYRLLKSPLGEETTPDILRKRMTNVMNAGISRILQFIITQKNMKVGRRNCQRMGYANRALVTYRDALNRIEFIERAAFFYQDVFSL